MNPVLLGAVIAITLALIFYTIGVWAERKAKLLKPPHLAFFYLGLICDSTGTFLMSGLAGNTSGVMVNLHGITGALAIILMAVHVVWATLVLFRGNEEQRMKFHRLSIIVWFIWLVPYLLGMFMGMSR